jgi:hypothetical protein
MFETAPTRRIEFRRLGKGLMKAELWRVLDALGREYHLRSAYSCKSENKREFLYDYVWLDRSGVMKLAVESESTALTNNVMEDFRKLIHAKAPLKMIVFSDGPQMRTIFQDLEKELQAYQGHVVGERYVAVQFCEFATGRMIAQCFDVVAPQSGVPVITRTEWLEHLWPSKR